MVIKATGTVDTAKRNAMYKELQAELWRDGGVVSFRARVVERDVVALNNGRAEIAL